MQETKLQEHAATAIEPPPAQPSSWFQHPVTQQFSASCHHSWPPPPARSGRTTHRLIWPSARLPVSGTDPVPPLARYSVLLQPLQYYTWQHPLQQW